MRVKECTQCNKTIEHTQNCDLCFKCQRDPTVTITPCNIKRKYKLSDAEIKSHKFKYVYKTFDQERYSITEVEELCQKIIKDLKPNGRNKKISAYRKQKHIMDGIREEKKKTGLLKIDVVKCVQSLLLKYDAPINAAIDDKIKYYTDQYCIDTNIDVLSVSLQILNHILDHIAEIEKENQRKIDLDILVNFSVDPKYIPLTKSLDMYNNYIKHNQYSLYVTYFLILNYFQAYNDDQIIMFQRSILCK